MNSKIDHSDATKDAGLSPGSVPSPDWRHGDPDHPGFVLNGVDNTPSRPWFALRSELLHEMLAYPAQLYRLDVLHGTFNVVLGHELAPA